MVKKYWPILLFFTVLVFVVYGNALNNAFLSDDLPEIVNNPNLGNFAYNLTHPSIFGSVRPLLYYFAFHIGGLNPVIFRLINVLLHLGVVILLFILFKRLYSAKTAFFVATIFAVHSAITEPIIWISGGGYPQYSFFFLLSFVLYIYSEKKKFCYLLSFIFYLLSFMSHPQMPTSLFIIFPLWEFTQGNLKKHWLKTVPYLLIACVYLLISLAYLGQRETTLQTVHYQQGGVDNPLILIPVALSSYFELIFWPQTLTLYHSELAFGTIQFIFRTIITLGFFAALLFSFKKNKTIFFWLAFFLIALAPTLTPFRLNWVVAERYLYLPMIGILAILGLGFDKLTKSAKFKQYTYITCILIVILLMVRTIVRNIDWKNEDNLWIATGKTSPSSPNTHNNLGDVYGRLGDKQTALKEFQRAIELKPNYGDAYHNLANTYMELNQSDKALENYQNALKFNPKLWQSYQNIAAIYFAQKKYDLAIQNLQQAIQINPNNLNLRLNLGVIYLVSGDKNKAKETFTLILSADPNNKLANQGLTEANK